MKKTILLFLALIFLLQAGCTHEIRYSEDEIKGFPPNVQENIRKGMVDIGMTPEQVRYAWGSPQSQKTLEPVDGKARLEWIYGYPMEIIGTKILLFVDGKLIYIK